MKITIKWNSLKFWWNEPFSSLNFHIPCTCKWYAIPRLCAHKFHININIKLWPPLFHPTYVNAAEFIVSGRHWGSAKKNWERQSVLGTASHPPWIHSPVMCNNCLYLSSPSSLHPLQFRRITFTCRIFLPTHFIHESK